MENKETKFSLDSHKQKGKENRLLTQRMYPQSIRQVAGQSHILSERCLLPNLIKETRGSTLSLGSSPGSEKTTSAVSKAKQVVQDSTTFSLTEKKDTKS